MNPNDEEESESLVSLINDPESEEEVSISVKRGEDILTLKGTPKMTMKQEKSVILEYPDATEKQKALLQHLLKH